MGLALPPILRTFWTLKLGGGDGRAVVSVLWLSVLLGAFCLFSVVAPLAQLLGLVSGEKGW